MKNILGAIALTIAGSFGIAASANAMPAASVAGLAEQATTSVEQVGGGRHGRGHRRFHGKHFFGFRNFHGGGGNGYFWWKKYCYYNPYHWKCEKFGFGY